MKIKKETISYVNLFNLLFWAFDSYPEQNKDCLFLRREKGKGIIDYYGYDELLGGEREVLSSNVLNYYKEFFRANDRTDVGVIYNSFLVDSIIRNENLKLAHFKNGVVYDYRLSELPKKLGFNYTLEVFLDSYSGIYTPEQALELQESIITDFVDLMGGEDEVEEALMTLFVFDHRQRGIVLDDDDCYFVELGKEGNPDYKELRKRVADHLESAYCKHIRAKDVKKHVPIFAGLRFESLYGLDYIKNPEEMESWEFYTM